MHSSRGEAAGGCWGWGLATLPCRVESEVRVVQNPRLVSGKLLLLRQLEVRTLDLALVQVRVRGLRQAGGRLVRVLVSTGSFFVSML